jgi:CBS domain-containing protein
VPPLLNAAARRKRRVLVRLQEIMNTEVRTIEPDASAEEARESMRLYDIRHLVVMEGKDVVGVLSERDLGGRRGTTPGVESVLELMSPQIITARPSTSVKEAANLLRGYGVGCLPVMEKGKLMGIVTVTDLLELIGRGLEKPVARTERAMLSRRQGQSPKRRT